MKIIVESGATKTDWCAVLADGSLVWARTAGINVAVMSEDAIAALVDEAAAALPDEKAEGIYFYAAGLLTTPEALDRQLCRIWPDGEKEYASDLLAAARAVCGKNPGIAAIMGTGSNSCLYDGEKVVRNIHSCGFILGDQGSGAVLGKMFMSDFLQERVPKDLAAEFAAAYDVDYLTVVKNVYRSDAPSKYLGQFAPWITSHYDSSEYVRNLVEENFRSFIKGCLLRYVEDGNSDLPVGIVGGFAYAYKDLVIKVAKEEGLRIDKFYNTAIDGLIEYHR